MPKITCPVCLEVIALREGFQPTEVYCPDCNEVFRNYQLDPETPPPAAVPRRPSLRRDVERISRRLGCLVWLGVALVLLLAALAMMVNGGVSVRVLLRD